MEKEVVLEDGKKITLKTPLAGVRNKSLMKAETPQGVKQTVLMIDLLPHCVKNHEWGTRPISQCLDVLSIKDYDMLVKELGLMLNPKGDDEKKSKEPSE